MKLLLVGLDNAGKTTIVKKFNGEDIGTISPTLGFQINTMEYKGYKLNIWDVGGQKTIRAYWRNYFETTEGLIWVVDSSDSLRLEDCRQELHKLLGEERLAGASLLIFANKQDIPGALPAAEIEAALQLGSLDGRQCRVQPCSAVEGTGLAEGVDWIVSEVASRLFLLADS